MASRAEVFPPTTIFLTRNPIVTLHGHEFLLLLQWDFMRNGSCPAASRSTLSCHHHLHGERNARSWVKRSLMHYTESRLKPSNSTLGQRTSAGEEVGCFRLFSYDGGNDGL
jgi:hypothetical protein